ncbi:DUF2523 family protein [Pseudomonas sp. PAGU 2196]|uniref:DUF2523 family protein n=1 Tax=Pseudomonas sp. PAGU 2196 TaxID=2793997 RepID=UPI001EE05190|nr:DUF2523 family protein [Pseudomonas sp. PAGU 2196]
MTDFAEWLLSIIRDTLQFFVDIPLKISEWLWDALLSLLSTSVVLGMIQGAGELFSQIDPSVWYFMQIFQVPYGISAIMSAYVLRFMIRRLPIIG